MTTQISLSLELISLINWMLKKEKTMLNSLVKHAIEHGFIEELAKAESAEQQYQPEELHNTLVDFLDFLEHTLIKNLETIQVDEKTKDAILPALQKIETDSLDFKTVWMSMQQTKARVGGKRYHKTASVVKKTPEAITAPAALVQNPMEILFEELLKNWKPNNKETVN
jgi:hypothetical protein